MTLSVYCSTGQQQQGASGTGSTHRHGSQTSSNELEVCAEVVPQRGLQTTKGSTM